MKRSVSQISMIATMKKVRRVFKTRRSRNNLEKARMDGRINSEN